jgi:hypothetical protein
MFDLLELRDKPAGFFEADAGCAPFAEAVLHRVNATASVETSNGINGFLFAGPRNEAGKKPKVYNSQPLLSVSLGVDRG